MIGEGGKIRQRERLDCETVTKKRPRMGPRRDLDLE